MAPEKAEPPPTPPPLPGSGPKDPIVLFQEQAMPILSQSGGVGNVECLVKLKALSQDLGLPEDRFDEAIASLQGEVLSGPEAAERERREKRFLKRLRKTLKLQHGNILSFRQRQNLVTAGTEGKHALPRPAVERCIDQVAREESVRFTTLEEAQQYVAELIRQVMGESPALDNTMRRRVWREGKKSGLSRGQIEEIIRKRVTVIRLHDWSNWLAPGAAILVGLGVVLFLVYLGYSTISTDPVEVVEPDPITPTVPKEPGPTKEDGDAWWDVRLAVAMGTARASLPDFWPILDRVRFNDPALRAEAYEDLIKQLFDKTATPKVLHDRGQAKIMREVIVGCYTLEPSDDAAARLRDALLGVIPARTGDPAKTVTDYDPIYWAMETAVAALRDKELDPTRADALALAIGERVQANFDRRLPPASRLRQSMIALTTHLYRQLIASVKSNSDFAWDRREALLTHGQKYLGVETRQSFDTDFLMAFLAAKEHQWKEYEDQLDNLVKFGTEPNVLRLFAFFQRCSNPELQTFLAEGFCKRFNVVPKSMTVKDVTRAVEDKIGRVTGDRRQMLEARVTPELEALAATADKPLALLDETIRLAQLATLGCALTRGDLGHADFDQGLAAFEKRTDDGEAKDEDATPPDPEPDGTAPPWVDDFVQSLLRPSGNITARVRALEQLARITSVVADVTPEQGTVLATYLLKPKIKREHQGTVLHLPKIGQWKSVRLALADGLADGRVQNATPTHREHVLNTVEQVLGKRFTPVAKQPWPDQQRVLGLLLLSDVYKKLGTDEPPETQTEAFDKGQQELTEFYRLQARLLGLPPNVYSTMASPAEALEAMIQHVGQKLAAGTPRSRDKKYLDGLPHQLAVEQYLGENDLAETVLLQRIWARLLAVSVAGQNPARAEPARKVIEDLQASDGKATHVLTQLRDGEAAILRMWMFLGEKKQ